MKRDERKRCSSREKDETRKGRRRNGGGHLIFKGKRKGGMKGERGERRRKESVRLKE